MTEFDISKPWILIAGDPPTKSAASELAHYIGLLRDRAGLIQKPPLVIETKTVPHADAPLIVLSLESESGNGFSWRLERDRLEVKGYSVRGLYNGVFDFLVNLGFRWEMGQEEEFPRLNESASHLYRLEESYGHKDSISGVENRKRLLFDRNTVKQWESCVLWAAGNQIDALVFPLFTKSAGRFYEQAYKTVKKYGVEIEAGGWDLSSLAPRKLFFFHREIFRMKAGERDKFINFCPTAPDTIRAVSKEAKAFFLSRKDITVFHFWPDRGYEKAWCSCPSCRAFTPEEQNRIAVNTVADVLLSVNPRAKMSYCETSTDKTDIELRSNIFKVSRLPERSGEESGGWVLA